MAVPPFAVIVAIPWGLRQLWVRFHDGTAGLVRFEREAFVDELAGLADDDHFKKVYIDRGELAWPCGARISGAPLHAQIQRTGVAVIRR